MPKRPLFALVHPFFAEIDDGDPTVTAKQADSLFPDIEEGFYDVESELPADLQNMATPKMMRLLRGVDEVAQQNGNLVVVRTAFHLNALIAEERQLFTYILTKLPEDHVHFFPTLRRRENERTWQNYQWSCSTDMRLLNCALRRWYGNRDQWRNVKIRGLGEEGRQCVLAESYNIHQHCQARYRAQILLEYCIENEVSVVLSELDIKETDLPGIKKKLNVVPERDRSIVAS